ncbi:cache domain-containing sensor histidine kinase [Paenibacillus sp.]|uniref:cache domain-containing sensor histidine kinase n=1 Tax=Paenibacillus sp. TaxID=58172 RepID=UPI002D344CE0|nr:histidine kinase [Paenibacillus sp.]HZG83409.1 histidine kinase [Paenibacillus sp.]
MSSILIKLKDIGRLPSLKYKLFILLLFISVLPILCSSYFWQQIMFRSSTEHAAEVSAQYVSFVNRELSTYLQDIERSLHPIITDPDFQQFLNLPSGRIEEQARLALGFRDTVRSSVTMTDEIVGLLYLDTQGKVLFESFGYHLDFNHSFEEDVFYRNVFQLQNEELSVPHSVGYLLNYNESVFSYVRPVVNLHTGQITSWLIVEIKEHYIRDMLKSSNHRANHRLLLYQPSSGNLVAGASLEPKVREHLTSALPSLADENHAVFTADQERYQVVLERIPAGDWRLLLVTPLASISEGLRSSIRWSTTIAVISVAFALVVSFPIMNHVLKPLYKLKAGLQRLGRGAYVPIPGHRSNDEFGFLVRSYNAMLEELKTMQREVVEANMKEKERELLQLQAQINPHFLFNTLETIELYAAKRDRESINGVVQNLSRMMRYSVKSDSGWVPLQEEMKYVGYFLSINRYRYGRDAAVTITLDPRTLELPIMKLSVQPFVENAIKYGWGARPEEIAVAIRTERTADRTNIIVHNTGEPIPEAVLAKLQSLIALRGQSDDPFFRLHTGIQNVCRRFFLAYGDIDVIRIESDSAHGTTVTITLPNTAAKQRH